MDAEQIINTLIDNDYTADTLGASMIVVSRPYGDNRAINLASIEELLSEYPTISHIYRRSCDSEVDVTIRLR